MKSRIMFFALTVSTAFVIPGLAHAHSRATDMASFASGFLHPISGVDHLIAMVAVGIWGALLEARAFWLLPLTFPLIMAWGGFLGLIGVPLPGGEIGVALSGLVLGLCVLFGWRAPPMVAAGLVGLFGLFHGHAHGTELIPGQNPLLYSLGFVLSTGLLHAGGIGIGLFDRWHQGRTVLRGIGAMIATGGASFLLRALA